MILEPLLEVIDMNQKKIGSLFKLLGLGLIKAMNFYFGESTSPQINLAQLK